MSLMGRALSGAADATSKVLNKYIDEDLAKQRAQMMSELQIKTSATIREQDDAFQNDPTRVARNRDNRVADERAVGGVRNEVALAGEVARETNTDLQGAKVANATAASRAAATTQGEVQREQTIANGTNPTFIKAQRALALATHIESASSVAQARLANLQADDLTRLSKLYDQTVAIQNNAAIPDDEKAKQLRPIITAIGAIKSKNGAGEKLSEFDTQKVTTEEAGPDGKTIKTERTERRKPGGINGGDQTDPILDALEKARAAKGGAQRGGPSPKPAQSTAPKPRQPGQQNLDAAAQKAGYTLTIGNDGKDYYKRVVDGQGEILNPDQLADKLGLIH